MSNYYRKEIGQKGEKIALDFFRRKGYEILEKNYSSPLGELDLVAKDEKCLVFIEVKTRTSTEFGEPEEAINQKKQHKLSAIAQFYIKEKNLIEPEARFDILSILFPPAPAAPEIRHIRHAFELPS